MYEVQFDNPYERSSSCCRLSEGVRSLLAEVVTADGHGGVIMVKLSLLW